MTSETLTPSEDESAPEGPAQRILKAAFSAFIAYGYRRTSMEDIAQKAGMSRPALYLHFRNKEAVLRSLVAFYFRSAQARVAKALAVEGPPAQVLKAALAAFDGEEIELLLQSPHGGELLDTKASVCADVVAAGMRDIESLFADWIAAAQRKNAVSTQGLSGDPAAIARLLVSAKAGIKEQAPGVTTYLEQRDSLAEVFGKALSA